MAPAPQVLANDAMEKAKKAAELQARIQAQMAMTGLGLGLGAMPRTPAPDTTAPWVIESEW